MRAAKPKSTGPMSILSLLKDVNVVSPDLGPVFKASAIMRSIQPSRKLFVGRNHVKDALNFFVARVRDHKKKGLVVDKLNF